MNSRLIAAALSLTLGVSPAVAQIPAAASPGRIGVAAAVHGLVQATAPGQSVGRIVQSGRPLYQNDHVTTDAQGRLQVMLLDETVFTLGPNSDMVLDEFVYDPVTDAGKVTARITKGAFRFVSGKIARKKPSNVQIKLPVGTIGIRGTIVVGQIIPGAAIPGGIGESMRARIAVPHGAIQLAPDMPRDIQGQIPGGPAMPPPPQAFIPSGGGAEMGAGFVAPMPPGAVQNFMNQMREVGLAFRPGDKEGPRPEGAYGPRPGEQRAEGEQGQRAMHRPGREGQPGMRQPGDPEGPDQPGDEQAGPRQPGDNRQEGPRQLGDMAEGPHKPGEPGNDPGPGGYPGFRPMRGDPNQPKPDQPRPDMNAQAGNMPQQPMPGPGGMPVYDYSGPIDYGRADYGMMGPAVYQGDMYNNMYIDPSWTASYSQDATRTLTGITAGAATWDEIRTNLPTGTGIYNGSGSYISCSDAPSCTNMSSGGIAFTVVVDFTNQIIGGSGSNITLSGAISDMTHIAAGSYAAGGIIDSMTTYAETFMDSANGMIDNAKFNGSHIGLYNSAEATAQTAQLTLNYTDVAKTTKATGIASGTLTAK
ncbi:MAG: FecR domain-containing protein [Elusimicrobia bacterium]|nr:FecR domain-containing protein [Elusimicrobiota bacterium]